MSDKLKIEGINSAGFGIIPKLVMQDRELSIVAKAIYSYFRSYTGTGDSCFPTRKKICYDLNISNDTFSKHLKNLVRFGYVKVEQIKENGRFSHNVYTISDTISPCPKISDTENFGNGKLDTKNNSYKNNSINKINSINNNDHFFQNDRLSQEAIKGTTVPVVGELQTKRSSLNNGIVISKSENKESIKENNSNSADNKKAPRVSEKQLKQEFENLWALYPRKQGKKVAEAAYIRARRRGVEADVVASGIKSYVDYINAKKISQEYIKQGSTFFNQNSWDDEWETGNKPVSTGNKGHKDSYLADLEVAREEARKFNDQKYLKEIDELERQYLEGMKKKEE